MAAKLLLALAILALAVVGAVALAAFFGSRDDATIPPAAQGPGAPRRAGSEPAVQPGNVLLAYRDARHERPLRKLAAMIGGAPDPALEAAGQAVLVRRLPRQLVTIRALSAGHEQAADSAGDVLLRRFVEYWLGRENG